MGTYDGFIATADALIRRKGTTAVLTRSGVVSYDPVTQTEVATSTQTTFRAVGLPPGRSADLILGSLVGRHVIEIYFAQKDQTLLPRPGDTVLWGGHEWNVIWATTYDPAADGPILTTAYVER